MPTKSEKWGGKRKRKPKVLTGLAAKLAIMRAICRAIERDKNE